MTVRKLKVVSVNGKKIEGSYLVWKKSYTQPNTIGCRKLMDIY